MMAGESNQIFSNLPLPYRALPTSRHIEDRRSGAVAPNFDDSVMEDDPGDQMLNASDLANPVGAVPGAYSASYNRYFAPPAPGWQMPQRPAPPPATTLPYIDPHQPIAPGPAGWNPHGDSPQGLPFTLRK